MEQSVISFLESQQVPRTAKDAAQQLQVDRHTINQCLYGLLGHGKVVKSQDTPPLWSLGMVKPMENPVVENCEIKTVIIVDLGNVHDCLNKLEPYANFYEIYAFADKAYNGWGVSPPAPPTIHFYHSKSRDKNAADIAIIWRVAELILLNPKEVFHFVIATKDQGFNSLKDEVESRGHSLEFVNGWDELKLVVE